MPGALIEIHADGESAVSKALSLYADVEERQSRLYERMGAALVENIRERWSRGEGLYGKWPLSVRVMRQGGTTLRDTSRLMNSITNNNISNGFEVGTDVEYGAIHHFGGEIKHEARQSAVYFRQNQKTGVVGNRFVRQTRSNFAQDVTVGAYTVKMPARAWLGLTVDDEQELLNIVEDVLLDE
ncbi:phage virion morphogenesis protein [Acinetobacter johnsonii]|uniref:phage virion morphogenesis protein n=1 Tax=Acinetobacter johnsonii TaxID=40214 RepID=UPI003AF56C7D